MAPSSREHHAQVDWRSLSHRSEHDRERRTDESTRLPEEHGCLGGIPRPGRNLPRRSPPREPNIVYIMLDEWGYFEWSGMGHPIHETPNIDRFAAEGIRFTQFLAGGSVCAPTRSTLMTGQHTGHTTVRSNGGGAALCADDITVARVLKEAGYATAGFGKWGWATPARRGCREGTASKPSSATTTRFTPTATTRDTSSATARRFLSRGTPAISARARPSPTTSSSPRGRSSSARTGIAPSSPISPGPCPMASGACRRMILHGSSTGTGSGTPGTSGDPTTPGCTRP